MGRAPVLLGSSTRRAALPPQRPQTGPVRGRRTGGLFPTLCFRAGCGQREPRRRRKERKEAASPASTVDSARSSMSWSAVEAARTLRPAPPAPPLLPPPAPRHLPSLPRGPRFPLISLYPLESPPAPTTGRLGSPSRRARPRGPWGGVILRSRPPPAAAPRPGRRPAQAFFESPAGRWRRVTWDGGAPNRRWGRPWTLGRSRSLAPELTPRRVVPA